MCVIVPDVTLVPVFLINFTIISTFNFGFKVLATRKKQAKFDRIPFMFVRDRLKILVTTTFHIISGRRKWVFWKGTYSISIG